MGLDGLVILVGYIFTGDETIFAGSFEGDSSFFYIYESDDEDESDEDDDVSELESETVSLSSSLGAGIVFIEHLYLI